jgi:hypothetical protein
MDKSTKQSKVLRKKYSAGKASDSELKQLDRRDHGQINALNKFHGYSKVKPSGKDRAFDMAQKLSAAKKKGK